MLWLRIPLEKYDVDDVVNGVTDGMIVLFYIVLSGNAVHKLPGANQTNNSAVQAQRHDLRSYLDYVGYLYQKMEPLPEQERFELGYMDFLQSPVQPLMDNLEVETYETHEKDSVGSF
ncbi:hypothetical protein L2E82_03308 [Cichorium intybus]|uniref:Uncharacterized protein n=1 Tax=Cichorium intybus TaxID=13427 RepID=A0ACB9H3B8_CICIN|nr:hypothetical protein L2E82_03308 [Cichorium intybus]